MLLHQGAASFTLWTGQPAPLDVMQAALEDARAKGLTSAEGEGGTAEPDAAEPGASAEPGAAEPVEPTGA
jgi:shikimate dehydrogenase